jgi:hypothetical protein
MKKQNNYRHGEICLLQIKSLPKGLKETKSNSLMSGSHGNSHSFDNGKLYLKEDGFTFGYLVAKDTTLLHPEHGIGKGALKKAKIEDGIYQLIKQQEWIADGFKQVID